MVVNSDFMWLKGFLFDIFADIIITMYHQNVSVTFPWYNLMHINMLTAERVEGGRGCHVFSNIIDI